MKCPKCAYLGFETSDRCRNCGYDFSLSVQVDAPAELPLHNAEGAGAPLGDFDLSGADSARSRDNIAALDLDRLIGTDTEVPPAAPPMSSGPRTAVSVADPERRAAPAATAAALPLFSPAADDVDDLPLAAPRPARPPLSVRRTTPEIPRGRSRTPRVTPPPDDMAMGLDLETAAEPEANSAPSTTSPEAVPADAPAGVSARLLAALIDIVLLAAIDAAVLYLTLAITGLTPDQASLIPRIPIAAFLLMMNAGYVVLFTAACGQTIGKMATGIRVIGDDGTRVDIGAAMLRAAGCAASLLTLGLGYLPAFVSAERLALQDRVAGTRVISLK